MVPFSVWSGQAGISGRGADAAIGFLNELLGREVFGAAVTPGVANLLVQVLGEGFGEAVGECFGHDRVVVIVVGLEARGQVGKADSSGDGECADGVAEAGLLGRNEVYERAARLVAFAIGLLAEEVESLAGVCACGVAVQFDIVADCVGVEESVNAAGGDELLGDDAVEKLLPVSEELSRLLAVSFVFEDARIDSLQAPGVEERRPVDVFAQCGEWGVFDDADAGELGCSDVLGAPFDGSAAGAGFLDGDDGLFWGGVALAKGFVLGAMLGFEVCALVVAQQT